MEKKQPKYSNKKLLNTQLKEAMDNVVKPPMQNWWLGGETGIHNTTISRLRNGLPANARIALLLMRFFRDRCAINLSIEYLLDPESFPRKNKRKENG